MNLGVLASHEGTTLQSLLDAFAGGRIPGRVSVVVSNNGDSGALVKARQAGVQAVHLSSRTHRDPATLDAAIRDVLVAAAVDVVFLAGYMKKLGPFVLATFQGRILNTHPALLPRFGGRGMYGDRVFEAVLEAGEAESGVSIHLVDPEYDTGPVVRQCRVPVLRDDFVDDLKARVRAREKEFVVETLAAIATGDIRLAAGAGQDLTAEVSKRLGKGLEWAAAEARRIIHDNDVERLRRLLAEYPALLSWKDDDDDGGLVGIATGAYADAGDAQREQWFTRGACAELLIDVGAVVMPSVCEGLLESRARGLLELFQRKGLLPRALKFMAALGDLDGVRAALGENRSDLKAVNEAFVCACRFDHETVASLLLDRSIALDSELGKRIDGSTDRVSFIKAFEKADFAQVAELGLWKVFVMAQVRRAAHGDLTAFVRGLEREPWLVGEAFVPFQVDLIGVATLNDREEIIVALLDRDPAILRRQPAPPSQAIEIAFTYAKTHLIPLLTRIWPVPDDLPHAAGMGDLSRVKRWFDSEGTPVLGDVATQAPATSVHPREPQWGEVGVQQVLDTALAWAVINRHFDVADFLLVHGADINTNWNSHEPASILHHLVFLPNPYESMRFLIDRGIDMTIKDYRWDSNAAGWARHGYDDEKMAQWLEEAERQQEQRR